jgi:type VI secretion system protein ImpL
MRKVIVATAVVLLAYLGLSWFTGNLLGLQGAKVWVLRGVLALIGLAAASVVVWYVWSKRKQLAAAESPDQIASGEDITLLVREAEAKLSAASDGKGGKLSALPVVFVIGDPGSAKTSTIVHCGLDAELLAGQVYQDTNLIPTRTANIWYAQRAVFVEAAGNAISEAGAWAKIARLLQPGRAGSVFGKSQPPRSALLVIEIEAMLRPGARDSLAALARTLRARLAEISQAIGINLPVYVLFTKVDRTPFFLEYVQNLTGEEAAQVLGVTVPMEVPGTGVYAEQETARLGGYFEQLFRSLAHARPAFLARENDAAKLPGAYEFPREFRKFRPLLVQFLVDLCRPSQLSVGPILRGFYFSGVRPVVINEAAPTPALRAPAQPARESALDATSIFRPDMMRQQSAAAAAAPQVAGTRKVPQWVFLSQLFHGLLLSDRVAMGAGGSSTKTNGVRRFLLASAAVLCLVYSICLIVSFVNNRALETQARDAAGAVDLSDSGGLKLASTASLQRLETLRQSLLVLTRFERQGAPLSYHWGLYMGDRLYPQVRRAYFEDFRRLLFGQTQTTLVETLRGLPATRGPEFDPTYDTLKAYLITTTNHDKSTREFLSPVLLNRWSALRNVDPERMKLASAQFDFYSDELKNQNPYTSVNDADAIAKARQYLKQFSGFEPVYRAMLADAARTAQPVSFNKSYPGSAEVVVNNYEVAGPFTKAGWDFIKNSLADPRRYIKGEEWVLKYDDTAKIDPAALGQQLSMRYYGDFVKQWRAYLKATSIAKYANLQDAAKKLNLLSANQSPLLAMFSLASRNTAVDKPEVANLFQPVHAVVPPDSADKFSAPSNQPYMNALLQLDTALEAAAAQQPVTDATANPVLAKAADARITTRQVAQAFRIDAEAHVDGTVQKLMEDPITAVEALLRGHGKDELNAKGKGFCTQYRALMKKYPFDPNASAQATVADVNAIFRKPDGALWTLYDANLQKVLPRQGAQYVAVQSGDVMPSPGFVNFFNQAAAFSEAIYAGGTPDPHITYSLKPVPTEGVKGISLQIDGQTLNYSGGAPVAKQFTWQGSGDHEAKATVKFGDLDLQLSKSQGLWAVFQFFAKAEQWRPSGNGNSLDWLFRSGQNQEALKLPNDKPLTVRFELDMGNAPPVFQKNYFARIGCVAEVAK